MKIIEQHGSKGDRDQPYTSLRPLGIKAQQILPYLEAVYTTTARLYFAQKIRAIGILFLMCPQRRINQRQWLPQSGTVHFGNFPRVPIKHSQQEISHNITMPRVSFTPNLKRARHRIHLPNRPMSFTLLSSQHRAKLSQWSSNSLCSRYVRLFSHPKITAKNSFS